MTGTTNVERVNDHREPAGHVDEGDDGASGADDPGLVETAEIDTAEIDTAEIDTATTEAATVVADLDAIARDLDGVEAALRRLDDGSYWTDEITGHEIPDDVLAADPVTRRAG